LRFQLGVSLWEEAQVDAIFESLTPRQREVLTLIAEGNSTKNIARLLNISVKTVETHRRLLMERLDIHNLAGLVRYAIEHRVFLNGGRTVVFK